MDEDLREHLSAMEDRLMTEIEKLRREQTITRGVVAALPHTILALFRRKTRLLNQPIEGRQPHV